MSRLTYFDPRWLISHNQSTKSCTVPNPLAQGNIFDQHLCSSKWSCYPVLYLFASLALYLLTISGESSLLCLYQQLPTHNNRESCFPAAASSSSTFFCTGPGAMLVGGAFWPWMRRVSPKLMVKPMKSTSASFYCSNTISSCASGEQLHVW